MSLHSLPPIPAPPADQALTRLLQIQQIYVEPAALDYSRAQDILARYPDTERIEVASHWQIPELHGNAEAVGDWNRIKRSVLVLGVKKSLQARPNCRSSDFVAPSQANGCAMACSYCYVARRKGFANPITTFVNIEQITRYITRHAAKQGQKLEPNQVDPAYWVYEIGENSDCSVDAAISDNVKDLVALFRTLPNAKATFATKRVNRSLLDYDPQGKTRIRFSLMPEAKAQLVDIRTSPIAERIAAINDFVEAGYEVHVNFAPVIYSDDWLPDYATLFEQLDDHLSAAAKAQLQAEVIFLTHNDKLHEVNLGWHPQGEALLWRPDLQEPKYSQTGGKNLRYRRSFKGTLVEALTALMAERLPYCNLRYAF